MKALGLIEVYGFVPAVEGADAALKAANVKLINVTKVGGGIVTVQLTGDVGAIKACVEAGSRAAQKIGQFRTSHVIPRVDQALEPVFSQPITKVEPIKEESIKEEFIKEKEITKEENSDVYVLEKMSNRELKEFIHDKEIKVNEKKLKAAKKSDLIKIISDHMKEGEK